MPLNKIIYLIGSSIRNPSLMKQYTALKESERWSRKQLEEIQMKKLRNLLHIAYEHTTYYRDVFDQLGIKPDDISSLEDLKRLPTLDKTAVRGNLDTLRNYSCKKVFCSETSGSTGEPMIFYRNEEWDSAGRAAQMRGYSWYGVNPWDKNGYLWGFVHGAKHEIKTKLMDLSVNRFRPFSYKRNDIEEFCKKLKRATFLEGYSSMIYEVSREINEKNLGPFNLKMVKGTSEKIYESYQPEVRKAFGMKMVSEYGSGESTLIAFECPCGNMHVVMENVIVEEDDGEIIVTNLHSYSMPIIRYRLGDKIILDMYRDCSCGMKHSIIEDVVGRVGRNIYGKTGKYPSLTMYYIFKAVALKTGKTVNYQGKQSSKGQLIIDLDRVISEQEERAIQEECMNYFGNDVTVVIYPDCLKREHNRKFQDFVTSIE